MFYQLVSFVQTHSLRASEPQEPTPHRFLFNFQCGEWWAFLFRFPFRWVRLKNFPFLAPFQVNPIVDDVHKRGDVAVKEFDSSSLNGIYDLVIVYVWFLTFFAYVTSPLCFVGTLQSLIKLSLKRLLRLSWISLTPWYVCFNIHTLSRHVWIEKEVFVFIILLFLSIIKMSPYCISCIQLFVYQMAETLSTN